MMKIEHVLVNNDTPSFTKIHSFISRIEYTESCKTNVYSIKEYIRMSYLNQIIINIITPEFN